MYIPRCPTLILAICLAGILVSGCAGNRFSSTASQVDNGSAGSESQADHECSYFYFLWGRHAELAGRYDEALEAYEKTLICDQGADYAAEKLPLLLIRMGRVQEARKKLESYLESHPEQDGARLLLARILIRDKQWDQAIAQYRFIHDRDPKETRSLLLLAELYLNMGKPKQALKALAEVLSIDADSYPGQVLTARILLRLGQPDRAVDHYRAGLAINWSSDLALELAEAEMQGKDPARAEAIYRDILEREPANEQAAIGLVHALLVQKKEQEALSVLDGLKGVSNDPLRIELTMARIYARRENWDRAASILSDVLADQEVSQARYMLGIILMQKKKYDQALAQLSRIGSDADEFEDAVFLRVRLLRLLKRDQEAIALLEKVLADDQPHEVDLYILLATMYQLRGQPDEGEAIFNRALSLFPKDDTLLYEFGLFLDQKGEPGRALDVMEKVLELDPDNAAALNYVGYTWADQKVHLNKALEYIQKAVRLKPDNGYIRDSLGWVYYRLGRLDDARRELEAASRLSPDDPAILDHRGDVYLELGLKERALEMYDKALSLSKEQDEKKRLQEKIRIVSGLESK